MTSVFVDLPLAAHAKQKQIILRVASGGIWTLRRGLEYWIVNTGFVKGVEVDGVAAFFTFGTVLNAIFPKCDGNRYNKGMSSRLRMGDHGIA